MIETVSKSSERRLPNHRSPFVLFALWLIAGVGAGLALDVSYTEVGLLTGDGGDFGAATDIDGTTLIVGAWAEYDQGLQTGAAHVYELEDGAWIETARLLAPDREHRQGFGTSVAIDGDWAMVGAGGDDDLGHGAGAVYVFERNAGGEGKWGFASKLLASDGGPDDQFGSRLAISGDTALVGVPDASDFGLRSGAAYVLQRDVGCAGCWGEVTKLLPIDGESQDAFGRAIAVDGDWVVVGSPGNNDLAPSAGALYLFSRDAGGIDAWGLETKILAVDGVSGDSLGGDVALAGDTLVAGVVGDDEPEPSQGSAYIFQRDAGGPSHWGQVAKLVAIDGAERDSFGTSVAIHENTIAVGAIHDDDNGSSSGSAYVFRRDEGGPDAWGKIAKLIPADGGPSHDFGSVASLDATGLMISAVDREGGAVYEFEEIAVDPALVVTGNCPGDVTFNFAGGTPLGQAALAFSQAAGNAVIPAGLCTGTETGLDVVNLLGILPVDQNGEITLDASLPFFVCGLQLQAVDLVSCATSNVAGLP